MASRTFEDRKQAGNSPRPAAAHPSALANLLERAAAGDLEAAGQMMGYLTAGIQDLRRMMSDSVHRSAGPRLWRCLLEFLAVGEWGEWDPFGDAETTRQTRLSWKEPRRGAAAEAIMELFLVDQSDPEATQKKLVLSRGSARPTAGALCERLSARPAR